MSADRQRGWLDYWKADCAASCEPDKPATARQIAALWEAWFAGFAEGSRILDIATGNGIVLAHAAAAARLAGRRFDLTGIDLADIDPLRYLRNPDPGLRTARFLGGTAAERLPFEDGSFDVLVSQYGLEYADLEPALAEAARVLGAGGTLVWLAHTGDSEIVRQHRRQAGEIDFLLADAGPVAAMRARLALPATGGDVSAATEALQQALTAAADYCRAHAPAPIVREVVDGFAALTRGTRPGGSAPLSAPLAEAERRLRAHRERIASLLDAGLTPERLDRVRAVLGAAPWTALSTTPIEVGQPPGTIGLLLRSTKKGV